jgi:hypothetical protein
MMLSPVTTDRNDVNLLCSAYRADQRKKYIIGKVARHKLPDHAVSFADETVVV